MIAVFHSFVLFAFDRLVQPARLLRLSGALLTLAHFTPPIHHTCLAHCSHEPSSHRSDITRAWRLQVRRKCVPSANTLAHSDAALLLLRRVCGPVERARTAVPTQHLPRPTVLTRSTHAQTREVREHTRVHACGPTVLTRSTHARTREVREHTRVHACVRAASASRKEGV